MPHTWIPDWPGAGWGEDAYLSIHVTGEVNYVSHIPTCARGIRMVVIEQCQMRDKFKSVCNAIVNSCCGLTIPE